MEDRFKTLGIHNTTDFKVAAGTPGFSSYIAYKVWETVELQTGTHMWDPYCGNGIISRVGAALFDKVGVITISDKREECVRVAHENTRAAVSPDFLQKLGFPGRNSMLEINAFVSDVFDGGAGNTVADESIDLVITDPPYENQETFLDAGSNSDLNSYIASFLTRIRRCIRTGSNVRLILDDSLYGDSVQKSSGYTLTSIKQIDPRYRRRFSYSIIAA